MSSRLSLIVLVLSIACTARGDDTDHKTAVKAQAEELQTALVKGDIEAFVAKTHPKLVEHLGGKDKMVKFMAADMKKTKEQGFELKSVKILAPGDIVRQDKKLYVAVPFTFELSAPGGRVLSRSVLLGVSDNGKTWTFVDTNGGREKLKLILPDLPEAIVFPKKEAPTFIKD